MKQISTARAASPGARVALAILIACSPGCAADEVTMAEERSTRLAMTAFDHERPVLLLSSLDGRDAVAVRFTSTVDDISGNDARLEVRDEALLNLAAPRWSNSGRRIAVVATVAYDRSVIVLYDAETRTARVASPNTQIIASNADWSPSGGAIAYTMSTLQNFGGIDVFVTDLATNQVTRLTTGASLALSTVRFDRDGANVFYSKRTGEESQAPFNSMSLVARVNVVTRHVDTLRTAIVGEVEGISRTGSWALVVRNRSLDGSRYRRQLIRLDLAAGAETVLIGGELLEAAQLGADDSRAVVTVDIGAVGARVVAFDVLDIATGRRDRLPGAGGATQVDVSPRPSSVADAP